MGGQQMFTGIVTDIGRVTAIERGGDTRFEIATGFDLEPIAIGASIAHSGVCLTVTDKGQDRFWVAVSAETLDKTTLGDWQVGTLVNLETSLKLGDEFGGHLVYGHVDGVAEILDIRPEGDSLRFTFRCPSGFARTLAPKGSVALDGVSLTVNEVRDGADNTAEFGVNIIKHTQQCTTFQTLKPGHRVNFEADMLARYVARMLQPTHD